MRTEHGPVIGTVESWSEDGWGVLRTPDGVSVFCLFMQVDVPGQHELVPGSAVYFDYERPGQDGCDGRVLTAARPADEVGMDLPLVPPRFDTGPATAYGSVLNAVLDDD